MPLVSIIIPAFNAEATIGETLASCLAQSIRDIEIIVIDDGSSDRTAEIAQNVQDSRVRVLRQPNAGVSAARNRGLDEATGHYVQFLDADDVLDRFKLENQTATLALAGDCGLSTSKWGRFFETTTKPRFVPAADWADLDPASFLVLQFGGGGTMPPNSWLMPRALIGALRFEIGIEAFEDRVFMAQMAERSERIVYCPKALSYYRSGVAGSLSNQRGKKRLARAFKAAQLLTEVMLRVEPSARMRTAAANYWLVLAVDAFPYDRKLAAAAEAHVRALGPPTFKPEAARNTFGAVARVAGWKPAALLRHWARSVA